MVCLGALCVVLPGRIVLGERTLNWPTLAEVFGESEYSEYSEYSEDSDSIAEFPVAPDSLLADTTPSVPTPVIPHITAD